MVNTLLFSGELGKYAVVECALSVYVQIYHFLSQLADMLHVLQGQQLGLPFRYTESVIIYTFT
jgi:hypothetical protein